jgi:hypothetical protein
MAKSLFVGGADFLASMVFMFASTNLVVELGIVLASSSAGSSSPRSSSAGSS